jgi:hypothetical protein
MQIDLSAPTHRTTAADLADHVSAQVQSAGRRGDVPLLRRLERRVVELARAGGPDDDAAVGLVQTMVRTWAQVRQFSAGIALTRAATAMLGFDALASSDVMLMLAGGDVDAARQVAEERAAAPVSFGGHGLRAAYRTFVGDHTGAAHDGATFVIEAMETHRSAAAYRAAARRYTTAMGATLGRFGHLYAELARAFPGSQPWRGEPVAGRTVALQLVEGIGDQIQALRIARRIRDDGGRVLVGCDEPLHALVRASGLADAFLPRPLLAAHGIGPADYHLVIGGWLHHAGRPAGVWGQQPYLRADDEAAPPLLDGLARPRVGLVWAGSPAFALEGMRGVPYGALKRLIAATPDVGWVSLQHADHPRARELGQTPVTRRVHDAGGELPSFAATAALMRRLDLVVTTDTSVAHLAGALGVPVWTLLGSAVDWRWGIEGERTSLYPSMRLIRDGVHGDWMHTVARVADDLRAGALDHRVPG